MVSTRQYSTHTSEWTISTTVNTLSSTNTANCCICGKWSGKHLSNLTRNELLNILHDDLEEVHKIYETHKVIQECILLYDTK